MGKKKLEEMVKQRAKFVKGCAEVKPDPREEGQRDLRPAREVRGLRFQQVALRRLRPHQLPHRLPQGNYPVEFMAASCPTRSTTPTRSPPSSPSASAWASRSSRRREPLHAQVRARGTRGRDAARSASDSPRSKTSARARWRPSSASARPTANSSRSRTFAGRLDSRSVNRKILENLIKAGAFDFTMERRDDLFSRVGRSSPDRARRSATAPPGRPRSST